MIQPGLERISLLLKDAEFPWKAIHVAGTNGKGSICHIATSMLKRRTIRVGTFSSPHLIDRWDCIKINNEPIEETRFKQLENHFVKRNMIEGINASPFEILTATALTAFNKAKIKIGIVEVGMGGRLDATNILNNQCVSVISKIARDHQAFLGSTLEEIAKHKAGILRPNVPYIVNPENEPWVQDVIDECAKEIGAGPRLLPDTPELRKGLYSNKYWQAYAKPRAPWQRDNAALAIVAVKQAMRGIGKIGDDMIVDELHKVRTQTIPGRLQYMKVVPVFGSVIQEGQKILVDGAHNIDAAHVLSDWVKKHERSRWLVINPHRALNERSSSREQSPSGTFVKRPITWVVAMAAGRDPESFLKVLLRPHDNIITTSFGPVDGMPWVKPIDPKELLKIAQSIHPEITGLAMPPDANPLRALCAARYIRKAQTGFPIVMTGSLYLISDLHRSLRATTGAKTMVHTKFWTAFSRFRDEQAAMLKMLAEEKERVDRLFTLRNTNIPIQDLSTPAQNMDKISREVELVDREIDRVKITQQQVAGRPLKSPTPIEKIPWRFRPVEPVMGKSKFRLEFEKKNGQESKLPPHQSDIIHIRPSFLLEAHQQHQGRN